MKKKYAFLMKSSFVRNVFVMASGTAAAQLVYMLLSPIITRLYGPEAYGLMGTFMAVVAIITPIAALTYPIAIVLPKNEREAKQIIKLSALISFLVAFVCLILLLILGNSIITFFKLTEISSFLYLFPLIIIMSGLLQIAENWLIRKKQFRITAKVSVIQAILLQGSMVLIGLFHPTATVLIIASSLGIGLKAGMMILFIERSKKNLISKEAKDSKELKGNFQLKETAKNYLDFPLFRAPEVFLNAVSNSLPILLLSIYFGPASAGFYTLGKTVLSIPSQLIGKSIGDVFYPRIAEASNNGENLTNLIKKATFSLGAIGIVPFSIIVVLGPFLFSFIFGAEWKMAGEYASWIAIGSFFGFINTPSVKALAVLSAQAFHLKYTIFMLITRIVVLVGSYYIFADDLVAVAFFGIAGALLNIGLILITVKISKTKTKR